MKLSTDTLENGAAVVNVENGGYVMVEHMNEGCVFITAFNDDGDVMLEYKVNTIALTAQEKYQQAFIEAIGNNGIPEQAAKAFMENGDDDAFCKGRYGEYYTTLQDCYNVWRDANLFMRNKCYGICERIGTEGDGQNCADEISKIQIDNT